MRWDPPQQWTRKFAWYPEQANCGKPDTGLGKFIWLEFVYITYRGDTKLVMTTEEYEEQKK